MTRIQWIALLATGGCALMTAPEPSISLPPAELPVTIQALGMEEVTEFRAEGAEGAILIRDRAVTGVCHQAEYEGAYVSQGTVTLWRAHVGETAEACIALGRLLPYEARVGGLAPGTYRVRVEYVGQIHPDLHPRPHGGTTVTVR